MAVHLDRCAEHKLGRGFDAGRTFTTAAMTNSWPEWAPGRYNCGCPMNITTSVEINGLSEPEEKTARAVLEWSIQFFIHLVPKVLANETELSAEQGSQFDLRLTFHVTDNFETTARRLHADAISAFDSTRASERPQFLQYREFVGHVLGKAFCFPTNSGLDAKIVLEASIFHPAFSPLGRMLTPIHELFHVLVALRRLDEIRKLEKVEFFEALAHRIHEEHEVDCLVDICFRGGKLVTDLSGNALGVIESLGGMDGIVATFSPFFQHWCRWVVQRVQRYRKHECGLDEVCRELFDEKIGDFFTWLAHSIAACRRSGHLSLLKERLSNIQGFQCYIAPDWDSWVSSLQLPRKQAISSLVLLESSFLARCGLRLERLESGSLMLHVSEPCFCESDDDETDETT